MESQSNELQFTRFQPKKLQLIGSQSRELQPMELQPREPYLCGFNLESFN